MPAPNQLSADTEDIGEMITDSVAEIKGEDEVLDRYIH